MTLWRVYIEIQGDGPSSLTIDTNSVFSLFQQQFGDAGPTARVQSPRDPFPAHRRFLAPAPRQRHFNLVPFAPARQPRFLPLPPPRFLPHDAPGLFLPAFPAVGAVMAGPNPLRRRRQQFLAELFTPQFIILQDLEGADVCKGMSANQAGDALQLFQGGGGYSRCGPGTFYNSMTIAPESRSMLRDDPASSANRPRRSHRAAGQGFPVQAGAGGRSAMGRGRSAPVLGRSNSQSGGGVGFCRERRKSGHCCARGRAHSASVPAVNALRRF